MFNTTKSIIGVYKRHGYKAVHITGEKGVGKTVYGIKILKECFEYLGYDEDSAYKEALSHIFFAKRDIIDFLKRTNEQEIAILWDDIRAHASGMSYFLSPIDTHELLGLADTMRTSACGFITTAPSQTGVLGFIKKEQGILVQIRIDRSNKHWRNAKGYFRYELPSGQMKLRKGFIDRFYYKLPDNIFKEVNERRKHYKDELIRQIEERRTKVSEKEARRLEKELIEIGK